LIHFNHWLNDSMRQWTIPLIRNPKPAIEETDAGTTG
jgi:hypothetical protein